jgi:hypothetical protein
MTAHKDLKSLIRERQRKTGESYTAARAQVMRARAELLGLPPNATPAQRAQVDVIVLKVKQQSLRVRLPAEDLQVTVRTADAEAVVPGQVVTLVVKRRWTWRGDAYASGTLVNPRIDIAQLGLVPLPLREFELAHNLRQSYEPFRRPDPYAPLWRRLTAKPRACYEMDPLTWGAFPDATAEDNSTCDAAELAEAGEEEAARELLMRTLLRDLRCLDAHAHLGNLKFERSPERALLHYEIGVRIGELSLPPGFDGALLWGCLYNRPFLRCLHGYGLCLWRLGRSIEASLVFERILALNPNDNQGVRFCWQDLRNGRTWEESQERETAAGVARRSSDWN